MITMTDLLDRLVAEGTLAKDSPAGIAEALAAQGSDSTPWYLHLLVGVGSAVAALLLLVFFGMSDLLVESWPAIITGLLLCAGSTGLRHAFARTAVLHQAPLAPALTGALMVAFGIWQIGGGLFGPGGDASFSQALAGLAAVELAMIFAYPDALHRFLATVIMCMALCWLLLTNDLYLLASLLAAALGWAAALAWQHESLLARRDTLARPVAYGLAVGLFAVVWSILLAQDTLGGVTSLGLAAALAYQIWQLLPAAAPRVRGMAAAAPLLLLSFAWGSPGLIAAPLILLVGFSRGNRIVVGLGALFLASYIIFYYYNLELTLLAKSFSLLGVGLALLGTRAVLTRARAL